MRTERTYPELLASQAGSWFDFTMARPKNLEDDWPESIESYVCGRDKLASEFGEHSSTAAAILPDAKPIVCSSLRGPYARQRLRSSV